MPGDSCFDELFGKRFLRPSPIQHLSLRPILYGCVPSSLSRLPSVRFYVVWLPPRALHSSIDRLSIVSSFFSSASASASASASFYPPLN